ncbi:hypothetical protein [Saccharospirillum salsuginis]|uniref:DUF4426 domain-containing protein n=1 Tax=Saccharospirillum salsuginis TaxID=418750 RepID=A0A918NGZ0_9GAMM|nr:hypothetical protein [Saccharospirillum salsuginis]GGX72328.1 hypothetical protein GCM10007392_44710 [Saccharospirillum salsuginis]
MTVSTLPNTLIRGFLLAVAALALSACGTNPTIAPYAGEEQGLVIFAADIKVLGDTELEYNYLFTVENKDTGETHRMRMLVEENKPYAVLGRLQPGQYRLTQREDIRRDARGIQLAEAEGEFRVEAGKITLPKLIEVEKKKYTRKVWVRNLSKEDAELIYNLDIAVEDEYQGWALLTD